MSVQGTPKWGKFLALVRAGDPEAAILMLENLEGAINAFPWVTAFHDMHYVKNKISVEYYRKILFKPGYFGDKIKDDDSLTRYYSKIAMSKLTMLVKGFPVEVRSTEYRFFFFDDVNIAIRWSWDLKGQEYELK